MSAPSVHLDAERCTRAVRSKDARFDGWFFTAVVTTGIYCRPSCPVRPPKAVNMRFYPSAAAAQAAGFQACKRCRPDASPGSPEWHHRGDVVARAIRLIADGVVDDGGVEGLASRLGYSARQLDDEPHDDRSRCRRWIRQYPVVQRDGTSGLCHLPDDPARPGRRVAPCHRQPTRPSPVAECHLSLADLRDLAAAISRCRRAVLGQQVSTAAARTHAARLVEAHGRGHRVDPDGGLTHLWPTAIALAERDPEKLALPRSRRATVTSLAAVLASGERELGPAADWGRARSQLLALPGVGPWTTEIIAMRGLGDPDAFPASDLGVVHGAAALGLDPSPIRLTARAEAWRPWRAYAVQHLWGALDHAINRLPT